ncbi:ScbA/BarX family gamma-butyrolactone biosynthesis protein [Streptomyces diastatochromogenes]|nr:ScbA/BarX family gamma-butyrolactone biosynthesis protein [Streptomyces diastatochromogenes]
MHRSDPADIFPTGWTRLAENRFSVSAHWPAVHPFFSPVTGDRHDPVLVAETIRQSTMLLAHAEFGVPVEDQFVMWGLHYTADAETLAVDGLSSEVTLDVVCSDLDIRRGTLRGLRATTVLTRDGRHLATGGLQTRCTSALAYRRIRGERMAMTGRSVPLITGVAPRLVGRVDDKDVVLAPGTRPGQWQLRVNTVHPTLFRRPNDHVPGMLLLEAARQAATAALGGGACLPTDLDVSYTRYAELDSPCWIEAEVLPGSAPGRPPSRSPACRTGSPSSSVRSPLRPGPGGGRSRPRHPHDGLNRTETEPWGHAFSSPARPDSSAAGWRRRRRRGADRGRARARTPARPRPARPAARSGDGDRPG